MSGRLRVGVVGHVELVTLACVTALPAPGEIVHAAQVLDFAGGGAGVPACILAALGVDVTLWTALGADGDGDRAQRDLLARGVKVRAARRGQQPTGRAFAHVDAGGERSITVLGDLVVPRAADDLGWEDLAQCDVVFLTAADEPAIRAARAAGQLIATSRIGPVLGRAGVHVDVVVGSLRDPAEDPVALGVLADATVRTDGERGGRWDCVDGRRGTWSAATPPGPAVDTFGCGDGFVAGMVLALGEHASFAQACEAGAREGARRLALRGPY